ncbi:MAG: hypothetical protein V4599_10800, partial [Verrucomicrobiota bacterium]
MKRLLPGLLLAAGWMLICQPWKSGDVPTSASGQGAPATKSGQREPAATGLDLASGQRLDDLLG